MGLVVLDPRWVMARRRLSGLPRVLFVESSKGGVGKTVFSTLYALALQEAGYCVGLFDADFTNPGAHTVLGVEPGLGLIREDRGVLPVMVDGIRFMGIAFYTGGGPLGLRGFEASNALVELLAVTRWDGVDILVVDTPPGISDEHMDLHSLSANIRVAAVSTPSRLSVESLRRHVALLRNEGVKIAGIVENMSSGPRLRSYAEEMGIDYIGPLPHDPGLEEAIGDPGRLRETRLYREIARYTGLVEKWW